MKTTITVLVDNHEGVAVLASVHGGLALHRTLWRCDGQWRAGTNWTITHVASGLSVVRRGLPAMYGQPSYLGRRILRRLLACGDWTLEQPDGATMDAARRVVGRVGAMVKAWHARRTYELARVKPRHRRAAREAIRYYRDAVATARFTGLSVGSILTYWSPSDLLRADAMRRARRNSRRIVAFLEAGR